MTRKTKPENETVGSSDAAAPRPRRPATGSRARRTSSSAATPVPPVDVDAVVTPSSGAAPKPRRKQAAPRATRTEAKAEPSREAIAELAYLYWQARGYRHGSADEDWLRAERELRERAFKSPL